MVWSIIWLYKSSSLYSFCIFTSVIIYYTTINDDDRECSYKFPTFFIIHYCSKLTFKKLSAKLSAETSKSGNRVVCVPISPVTTDVRAALAVAAATGKGRLCVAGQTGSSERASGKFLKFLSSRFSFFVCTVGLWSFVLWSIAYCIRERVCGCVCMASKYMLCVKGKRVGFVVFLKLYVWYLALKSNLSSLYAYCILSVNSTRSSVCVYICILYIYISLWKLYCIVSQNPLELLVIVPERRG